MSQALFQAQRELLAFYLSIHGCRQYFWTRVENYKSGIKGDFFFCDMFISSVKEKEKTHNVPEEQQCSSDILWILIVDFKATLTL